jgi:hypothetical protein
MLTTDCQPCASGSRSDWEERGCVPRGAFRNNPERHRARTRESLVNTGRLSGFERMGSSSAWGAHDHVLVEVRHL